VALSLTEDLPLAAFTESSNGFMNPYLSSNVKYSCAASDRKSAMSSFEKTLVLILAVGVGFVALTGANQDKNVFQGCRGAGYSWIDCFKHAQR
jgi:hypothetical protein